MITTCKAYINKGAAKIWDQDKDELLRKIEDAQQLNKEYQKCFHKTKEKLKVTKFSVWKINLLLITFMLQEDPKERQFEFSENYIFGKFDTFCKRLDKIKHMLLTIKGLAGIQYVKIEGIDSIALKYMTKISANSVLGLNYFCRYQNIVANIEKKKYDCLDHRKAEFDVDHSDFLVQVEALQMALQEFLDSWFVKPLTTEHLLGILQMVYVKSLLMFAV